jgi:hypothetical protein
MLLHKLKFSKHSTIITSLLFPRGIFPAVSYCYGAAVSARLLCPTCYWNKTSIYDKNILINLFKYEMKSNYKNCFSTFRCVSVLQYSCSKTVSF